MNPPIYTGSKIVENLEEECMVAMLHATMGLSSLRVNVSILGHGTGQGKLRRIFEGRVVLKSRISLGLRRDSPTKGSQFHPRVAMIGILSQS